MKIKHNPNYFIGKYRLILLVAIIFSVAALVQIAPLSTDAALLSILYSLPARWLIVYGLLAVGIFIELVLLLISFTPLQENIQIFTHTILTSLAKLNTANLILFALLVSLYGFTIFGPYGHSFPHLSFRLMLFWHVAVAGCILLKAWDQRAGHVAPHKSWGTLLGTSLLFTSFGAQIAAFLPQISTYPFTMSWSETSRFYYASLFFAKRVYGVNTPPSVLHPTRYMMQAIPFLISNSPLWLHRAWQVVLWLTTTTLTSYLFICRLNLSRLFWRWLVFAWAFLFILLGPIYYHLQVTMIIILWGYKSGWRTASWDRRIKAVLIVLIASLLGRISRVNWYPVPGLLAAALYFLEQPIRLTITKNTRTIPVERPKHIWSFRSILKYLLEPAAWFILGTSAAIISQAAYVIWSGNRAEEFTSSFSSELLWYRLLPNVTYPPGILIAILFVSLPLFLLIFSRFTNLTKSVFSWRAYHSIRLIGLVGILLVLFAGGLVVSVKIGGGSNLHNLDAYLALLLVITGYLHFDKGTPDWQINNQLAQPRDAVDSPAVGLPTPVATKRHSASKKLRRFGIRLALLTVITTTTLPLGPYSLPPNRKFVDLSMTTLTQYVVKANQENGKVLFISNRHLVTFQNLDTALVPDYERVFLMEMAMSGNRGYLDKFKDDLKNQRYAVLVFEPTSRNLKDENSVFGEENNAWVIHVVEPILCYYRPTYIERHHSPR